MSTTTALRDASDGSTTAETIPDVTQEMIDNANTLAIQKNALAISVCVTSIQNERDRAMKAEKEVLASANHYTDLTVSTTLTSLVQSVNGEVPDASGNITLTKVPFANNIYSSDGIRNSGEFVARTAGGDASLASGSATLEKVCGNAVVDEKSGKITIAKPTEFVAIGFNAFDKSTMTIAEYNTFGDDGKLAKDDDHSDYVLCYVRTPVSDSRGWQIYNPSGNVVKVGWCKEIPTASSTVTRLVKNAELSEESNDVYTFEEDGYLVIVTTHVDSLCAHPRWSGRNNWHLDEDFSDYELYSESVVKIPTTAVGGAALPTATYGMPGIGDVRDTIDFEEKTYVKKIQRMDYSEENLSYANSQSSTVIHDDTTILYVLKDFVTYQVDVDGSYDICDYGTEMFKGTDVTVYAEMTYISNLRDTLRNDCVTYSDASRLSKTDAQKAQARKNIGAVGSGETVESVNGIKPDSSGELTLDEVPFANNLVSTEGQEIQSNFVFRTAGGDATITNGSAYLLKITGYANTPRHVAEAISLSNSEAKRINAEVDSVKWIAGKYGTTAGTYVFNYTTKWTYFDESTKTLEDVALEDVGITVGDNYVLEGDQLTVAYSVEESEGKTIRSVSITSSEKPHLSVKLDESKFKTTTLGESSNQYKFAYESGVWNIYSLYSNKWVLVVGNVVMTDYGMDVSGTPIDGDASVVEFTRKYDEDFSISNPKLFKATGFNCFNKGSETYPNSQTLAGYTIDDSGNVVESAGSVVAYAHVVGGLANGYQVYNGDVALSKVLWSASVPKVGSTGITTVVSEDATLSEDAVGFSSGNKLVRGYRIEYDGYLVIVTTDVEKLCVHPRWSGTVNWRDAQGFGDYEEYVENDIVIPTSGTLGGETAALPTSEYGIPSVGDVSDVLDLDNRIYTKNIGMVEFSEQNLSNVISKGVPYSYDNSIILYQLDAPVVYKLADDVTDEYDVCDYGHEEFVYADGVAAVTVYNSINYGQSLKDKLRRDVVTISAQSLTDAEKAQVGLNVGMRYRLLTKALSDETIKVSGTDVACKTCSVEDFAINSVEVTDSTVPVYIFLPPKPSDGRARDFLVRVAVTSAEAPSIAFMGTDEDVDYESADDEWATIEPGSNLFSFTETMKAKA